MKCTAAPFLRSDVGDGFGKVPSVAVKILSVILALAIGLVLGFRQDDGSVLSRSLAVSLNIFDANLNGVRAVGNHVAFGDGEAAVAGFHLDAVIRNAKSDREAESLRQPIRGCTGVRVNQYRDHRARRHRSVETHRETLSRYSCHQAIPQVSQ